jgi:hypothetical protein
MKFYYSSMRSYQSHLNRGTSNYGPLLPAAPWLQYAFPSFWDWYTTKRNGRVKLFTMPAENVILDSGAHSFFAMNDLAVHGKKREKVKVDVSHYHGAYMNFIEYNWDHISYFVELDVADVFGFEWVQKMRADYVKRGLYEKCIPAWHRVNGMEDFEAMLECPSRYIGLQGLRPNEPLLPYNSLLQRAYEAGVRVHGFALTNGKVLDKYPFYSVDSTSWLQGIMYGSLREFRRGQFKTLNASRSKPGKKPLREAFYDDRERILYGIREVRKAEHHFTQYWKARGVDWEAQLVAKGTPPENEARYPRVGEALPFPAPYHELTPSELLTEAAA